MRSNSPQFLWVTNLHTQLEWTLRRVDTSKGMVPCTGPCPFFWNEWVGWWKEVVPCAHPSQPRTGTPHGWVSHILCCARTGANERVAMTITKGHVSVWKLRWPDRPVTLGTTLGHFVLQVLSFEEYFYLHFLHEYKIFLPLSLPFTKRRTIQKIKN